MYDLTEQEKTTKQTIEDSEKCRNEFIKRIQNFSLNIFPSHGITSLSMEFPNSKVF